MRIFIRFFLFFFWCANVHGQDLANGLLGHWPMDGNFSDISGNARHATLSNVNGSTPGFTTGKIFKAVDFDGTDDYLSVPHDSGIDLRRTISFSSWLKLDNIPTNTWSPFLYKGGSSSSLRTYTLWLNNTSRYFHGTSTDSQSQQNADSVNNSFAVNEWMNLVLLVDRNHGFIRVYKNNSEVAVVTDVRTTDTVSNSNPLLFGSSQETNSGYVHIDGQFDDLRLYNRILSTTEIAFLFNAANTDTDSDGLTNAEEELLDTNVSNSDSDGDGLTDFEEINGFANTYKQINGSFTWAAAKADAESKGGYLATITSSSEKNAVEQVRTQNSWLGASDVESEGNWKWVTGEPWSYTSWNNGEPNGGTGENYLLTWTSNGNWNDSGSSGNPYILEKVYYSDPISIDSDGDGYSDYNESQGGTDPSSFDSSPLAAGLVGHWKFDESSGDMANDSSGNNYHAQLFGAADPSVVWVTGKVGGAIQLDGSNHYLAIQSLHYNQAGQIPHVTTAAWVKTSQASEGIVMSFDRSEYWRFAVGGDGNKNGLLFFASANANGQLDVYGQTSVSDNLWHHIGATYSTVDGFVRLYVDGTLDRSQNAHSGQALGTGVTRFGIFSANNEDTSFNNITSNSRSMKFSGLIDDARVYNRALSASEISILAGAVISTNVAPTNLELSHSLVNENEPVESFVGQFSATDPDGDTVSFHLVQGTGDTGNAHFILETNGSLKTAVIFDFENNASTYSIRVEARDENNLSTEGNFTITLQDIDEVPPVISLNGGANIIHEAGTVYIDAGATWTDTVDGTGNLSGSGQVNGLVPGVYTLTFNKTDSGGNSASTVIRMVNVVDSSEPVISLNGNANISIGVWQAFLDEGVGATDTIDGNLTASVQVVGEVNSSVPGTYIIIYRVSDSSGNQAVEVSRSVTVTNQAPDGITLNSRIVEENMPVGTAVGQFSTSDADDPNGIRAYSYELMTSENNQPSLFEVDENGTLITSAVLDFEQSSSHTITVRSSDQFGGYIEAEFEISVSDAFFPIVQTELSGELIDGKLLVQTNLLDSGGNGDLSSWGVFVSGSSIMSPDQVGVTRIVATHNSGDTNLQTLVTPESTWTNIYLRAYAQNLEGTGLGVEKVVTLKTPLAGDGWANAQAIENMNGWWISSWWGSFYQSPNGWSFHEKMGWVYPKLGESASVWMWKDTLGWLWTKDDLYPFMYRFDSGDWTYFLGTIEQRVTFYDYNSKDFIKLGDQAVPE